MDKSIERVRARHELACLVMGTIFLVYVSVCMSTIVYGKPIQKNCMLKCVG